jgi:hypothetical protein
MCLEASGQVQSLQGTYAFGFSDSNSATAGWCDASPPSCEPRLCK